MPTDKIKIGFGKEPWDRQPHETWKAYEAFLCYRDLGELRSIHKAAIKLGKSGRLLAKWSSRWQWVNRINAWNEHQAHVKHVEHKELVEAAHEKQRIIGQIAIEKIHERLEILDASEITPQYIAPIAKMAQELQAAGLGTIANTNRLEITGKGGSPLRTSEPVIQVLFDNGAGDPELKQVQAQYAELDAASDEGSSA